MLRIVFTGGEADIAAKLATAMADGYIYQQIAATYPASQRARASLQEPLQTWREQAAAAERAGVESKAKNNMVSAGGSLMSDKQLSEISGQLASARAQASELQARLERIETVRQAYQQEQSTSAADETVSEATNSGII